MLLEDKCVELQDTKNTRGHTTFCRLWHSTFCSAVSSAEGLEDLLLSCRLLKISHLVNGLLLSAFK